MFKGSMPALITPFKEGAVDFDALKHLVEWHIEQGSHGLVPMGTTGESPTVSHDEHDAVVECVVKAAAGRVPVIAGAGSNYTVETVRLVEHAKAVGADAALIVTPYYNKPTQRGLIAHYLAAADFVQMSAEDASALGFNAHGGVGCISVTANVAPKLSAEFQNAMAAGDYATALTYQDKLMPLHEAIFTEPGLIGAKYGVSLLGKCKEDVRLPHVGLEQSTKDKIAAAMRGAGLIN
jgi:4-hydroxy-tetrahydrodipicolinate synthase